MNGFHLFVTGMPPALRDLRQYCRDCFLPESQGSLKCVKADPDWGQPLANRRKRADPKNRI
jgi:hypothetical protein